MKVLFWSAVATTTLLALPSHAEPRYKLNKQQTAAIEVSNLSTERISCHPDRWIGRIVAVKYNEMQTLPVAFTIEEKDGERVVINVDVDELLNSSRLAQGWVGQALQRMVRKGRTVKLGVKLCGASGRFVVLDAIRAR